MFGSILIANRGEIACRIVRACRRLGIATVAVHSDADADSLHVHMADRRVRIGPAEAAASYLKIDAVMEAALATGAEAIHPGYGFLSERPELAEACARAGIGWIGPDARCIALMGSKLQAKSIAAEHKAPCLPGYGGEDQSPARLRDEAEAIGFPILIKASAGGGGRGMRKVGAREGLEAALESARREAAAAFGDDRVLLEKLLLRPRHLEVQIAGDKHGGLIHLLERECSVQRNYQKVVEEAPAPNLAPAVRGRLFDSAVRLGRAIGYDSLGTVEFLLDADDPRGADAEPYFMEMNTRLQVEHPVTELITGLDLVELQIRLAAGEPLPFGQEAVSENGWAVEARVAAEAPEAGYAPCVGTIRLYSEPSGAGGGPREGVRCDSGVRAGSQVTPHYDSMLAKLIAWAPERAEAVDRLHAALSDYCIAGIGANTAFLRDVLAQPDFRAGVLATDFLSKAFPDGWRPPAPDASWSAAAAAAALDCGAVDAPGAPTPSGPWASLRGFRLTEQAGLSGRSFLSVTAEPGGETQVALEGSGGGRRLSAGGALFVWRRGADGDLWLQDAAGLAARFRCVADGDQVFVWREGYQRVFTVIPQAEAEAAASQAGRPAAADAVVSPMPGLVTMVHVAEGQAVTRGQPVVAMEAMKLMLTLEAPRDAVVRAISAAPGATVAKGAVLVQFEPCEAKEQS